MNKWVIYHSPLWETLIEMGWVTWSRRGTTAIPSGTSGTGGSGRSCSPPRGRTDMGLFKTCRACRDASVTAQYRERHFMVLCAECAVDFNESAGPGPQDVPEVRVWTPRPTGIKASILTPEGGLLR